MRATVIAAALIVVLLLAPVIANACDPSGIEVIPESCCFLFCPGGDIPICFHITYYGDPLPYEMCPVNVEIECLDGCVNICPDQQFPCYPDTSWAGSSYIDGTFCWFIRVGGCCPQLRVSVYLDGETDPVAQVTAPIKSVDLTCDGVVDEADESALIAAMGSNDFCADLDCNGIVDDADLAIFNEHIGHSCEGSVGVENASWGAIKDLFK